MERLLALFLSLVADALQIFITPLLVTGVGLVADTAVDIAMCVCLVRLRGYHWVFLPTFVVELIPGVDVVPFWTMAVVLTWNTDLKKTIATKTVVEARKFPPVPTLPPN